MAKRIKKETQQVLATFDSSTVTDKDTFESTGTIEEKMKFVSIKFENMFSEKNIGVVGKSDEIMQIKYAIATQEHMLMTGEAGTAKSMLANKIFNAIEGSTSFAIHMTNETDDDQLFGPIDINEYRTNAKYVRHIQNTVLDSEYLFLDEIFDASEETLRKLLGVLNERKWIRGSQVVDTPLKTAIATANYTVDTEKTKAVMSCGIIVSPLFNTLSTSVIF